MKNKKIFIAVLSVFGLVGLIYLSGLVGQLKIFGVQIGLDGKSKAHYHPILPEWDEGMPNPQTDSDDNEPASKNVKKKKPPLYSSAKPPTNF